MNDIKGEWGVAYKDQGLGHGMYGVVVKNTNEVLFEDITKEKAEEIVCRWNSQPDLLTACKRGHARLLEMGQSESMDTPKILEVAIANAEKGTK